MQEFNTVKQYQVALNISKHIKGLKKRVENLYKKTFYARDPKIFIVGFGRTGTTSLKWTFDKMGYLVGDQHRAEQLLHEYNDGNFEAIIDYCRSARVFQDTPFSLPETFRHMDEAYPDAKFILTVRDTAEQWFGSLVAYKTMKFGGKLPTPKELKETVYNWKGWYWENHVGQFGPDESDIWDPQMWMSSYNDHNREVIEYFKGKPDKLLVLNLREPNAFETFCSFIGVKTSLDGFPHLNKS